MVEKAIGPEVMRAIASAKAGAGSSTTEGRPEGTDYLPSSALIDLIGTETTGGMLQVTGTQREREKG